MGLKSKGAAAPQTTQLELPIAREVTQDRNADKGGRSFYFFDFDDNVAFLSTPLFIFHKETRAEMQLSSGEFARVNRLIGKHGPYANYQIDFCDLKGTFRHFRDQDTEWLRSAQLGSRQIFVEDLAGALGLPDVEWKGPSWSCFEHAALNQRPMSLITARGHSAETIRSGIQLFVERGFLAREPNYLSIYPVSHPEVRAELGDKEGRLSVAALKKAAIRASVEKAIEVYGMNPYHRFGMSDDDPHNIELIREEMLVLKNRFPEMSFFIIETQAGRFVKWEVYQDRTEATLCAKTPDLAAIEQLTLLP